MDYSRLKHTRPTLVGELSITNITVNVRVRVRVHVKVRIRVTVTVKVRIIYVPLFFIGATVMQMIIWTLVPGYTRTAVTGQILSCCYGRTQLRQCGIVRAGYRMEWPHQYQVIQTFNFCRIKT